MARFLFLNPPLVLEDDFIDYPYFANHGLLACAALAARSGADVSVHDAFALPDSGRHRRARGGWILGVDHDEFVATLPRDRYDVVVLGAPVFLRIEAAHPETRQLIAALRERFPRAVLLPRRHRRHQLRSLPRALLRRRRLAEHVRGRPRDALVRDQHRLPAPVHLLHEQPGLEANGA